MTDGSSFFIALKTALYTMACQENMSHLFLLLLTYRDHDWGDGVECTMWMMGYYLQFS